MRLSLHLSNLSEHILQKKKKLMSRERAFVCPMCLPHLTSQCLFGLTGDNDRSFFQRQTISLTSHLLPCVLNPSRKGVLLPFLHSEWPKLHMEFWPF